MSAIYAVMLSILNLSNATKNQKDAFSSFVQSYFSKLHNAIYYLFAAMYLCESNSLKMAMGSFGIALLINALIGMNLLNNLYGKGVRNSVVIESLIDSTEEEESVADKEYNNRLPKILESNELTTKMFSEGWKFDLFNSGKNTQKQLFGAAIIFAMVYFSLVETVMTQDTLSISVFVYSVICLFSYFNVTYVRDFDAMQINIVPIVLTIIAMIEVMHSSSLGFSLVGMTTALLADSYFAMKYQSSSDKLEFNNFELFAQESWTQSAFNNSNSLRLQIFAPTIIFVQIFLTMAGAMDGQIYAGLFLSFYMARLVQYLFASIKGVEMYQSNMICVVLAAIACKNTLGLDVMSTACAILMVLDAYIGAVFFAVKKNIHVTMFDNQFSSAGKVMRRIRLGESTDASD
jgi:hypothetical protein